MGRSVSFCPCMASFFAQTWRVRFALSGNGVMGWFRSALPGIRVCQRIPDQVQTALALFGLSGRQ